jgi:DNA-binding CsgD family transcriptional regulator
VTNLSRPEIVGELSVSPNTVSTRVRSIYAELQDRGDLPGHFGLRAPPGRVG